MLKYIIEIRAHLEFIENSAAALPEGLAKEMLMQDIASIRTYLRWSE